MVRKGLAIAALVAAIVIYRNENPVAGALAELPPRVTASEMGSLWLLAAAVALVFFVFRRKGR